MYKVKGDAHITALSNNRVEGRGEEFTESPDNKGKRKSCNGGSKF
jgi:hypothetical protein